MTGPERKPQEAIAALAAKPAGVKFSRPAAPPPPGGWDPPVPIPDRPPVPAFPLGLFPPVVADWWQSTAATIGIAVDVPGTLGVAALCTAAGRAVAAAATETWSRPPLVWASAVAPPGAGKTGCLDAVIGPIRRWDEGKAAAYREAMEVYEAEKAAHKDAMKLWMKDPQGEPPPEPAKPIDGINLVENVTTETLVGVLADNPRGCGFLKDELSGFSAAFGQFKGGAGSDREESLQLWNSSGSMTALRGGTGERRKVTSGHRHLTVGGCMTPATASQFATGSADGKPARNDGFGERFLVAWPDAVPARPLAAGRADRVLKAEYEAFLRRLLALEPAAEFVAPVPPSVKPWVRRLPREVPFDRGAFDAWQARDKARCEIQNALDEADPFRGFVGKLPANALALSGLFFLLRKAEAGPVEVRDDDRITAADVDKAWDLVLYFLAHAGRVWAAAGATAPFRQAKAVLAAVRGFGPAKGTVTRRELYRRVDTQTWASGGVAAMKAPLDLLVDHGYLRPVAAEEYRGPGRPAAERYAINPATFAADGNCVPVRPAADGKQGDIIAGGKALENKPSPPGGGAESNCVPLRPAAVADQGDTIAGEKTLENKAIPAAAGAESNCVPLERVSERENPLGPPARPVRRFGATVKKTGGAG